MSKIRNISKHKRRKELKRMRPEEIERLITKSHQVDFSRQRADRYMARMKVAELEVDSLKAASRQVQNLIDMLLEELFKYTNTVSIPRGAKPTTVQFYAVEVTEEGTTVITKKTE